MKMLRRQRLLFRALSLSNVSPDTIQFIHCSTQERRKDSGALGAGQQSQEYFDAVAKTQSRDKVAFQAAVDVYLAKETIYRRGHVEFLYAALNKMKEFGVHRDLSVYKQLLEVFPAGKMVARTTWQVEMMHYPRQQQCAIDIMEQMENNGVVPDVKFGKMLAAIFGEDAHAFRKYRRIMYWLPKFRNANPFPVPYDLPVDPIELAIMALKRMAVDLENRVSVWKTAEEEEHPPDDTFIANAISPRQKELIARLNPELSVFVEGGFKVWLRGNMQTYFVLRVKTPPPSPPVVKKNANGDEEDLFNWKTSLFEDKDGCTVLQSLIEAPSVHEQADGTVLAMCITGSASRDSLVSWIRCLQKDNPNLARVPVVFMLRTPEAGLETVSGQAKELVT